MLIDLRQNAKRASKEKIFRSTTQIPSRNTDPKKNFFIILNLFFGLLSSKPPKSEKKAKKQNKNRDQEQTSKIPSGWLH